MIVFFKQKTAYEMRISDWSSDVCSSDLEHGRIAPLQQTVEHVEDDDRARIADMSEVVDGRSADIHPHTLRIDRFEYFLHPCQGVVQNQRHASSLQFFFRASGTTTPSSAVTPANGVPFPSTAPVSARPLPGSRPLTPP